MQDEFFQTAIRLHVVYVVYVKGHLPHVTDGWTGIPNTGRPCEAEYVVSIGIPCTVDILQCSGNREAARRALDRSSARDMGYNLRPPAQMMKCLRSRKKETNEHALHVTRLGKTKVSSRKTLLHHIAPDEQLGSKGKNSVVVTGDQRQA